MESSYEVPTPNACIAKRRSSVVILSALAMVLGGSGLGFAAPPWSTTLPQDRQALYVLGVATGRTIEEAQRAALLNAAAQVAEHIEVTVGGSGSRLRTELEHRLTEELTFSSERMPLSRGLVQKWHFEEAPEGHRVWCLVRYPYTEIERAKSNLQSERTERITRYHNQIQRGNRAWDAGQFDEAFKAFASVLESGDTGGTRSLETDARERLTALVASIEFRIVSGDGQVVDPIQGFNAPLIVRVISRRHGTVIPLAGVPIRFAPETERTLDIASAITDEAGEAQVTPRIAEAGWYRIRAEIDEVVFDGVISRGAYRKDLPTIHVPAVVFGVKVVPVRRPTRVVILVRESNLGRVSSESIVAQMLSERLAKTGYRVVAEHEIGRTNVQLLEAALHRDQFWPLSAALTREADLVVTGTVVTRQGSDNLGWVFSTHATVYVRVIDLRSGEVVAQQNLTARVAFGASYEDAGVRALEAAGQDVAQAVVDQLALRDEEGGNVQR